MCVVYKREIIRKNHKHVHMHFPSNSELFVTTDVSFLTYYTIWKKMVTLVTKCYNKEQKVYNIKGLLNKKTKLKTRKQQAERKTNITKKWVLKY